MWTLLLLVIAVITDMRAGRISNRLICLGIATGFFVQIWESGYWGLILSVLQIFFPVIVLFLLFLMHALGAGDIKLFSVIGSIWNLKVLCYCMFFSFVTGAIISLVKLLYQKNLFARLIYFFQYIGRCLGAKSILIYREQSEGNQNIIHFSVAILAGFCITMGVIM